MTNINAQAIAFVEAQISEIEGNILFWQNEMVEVDRGPQIFKPGALDRIRRRIEECERLLSVYTFISVLLVGPNVPPKPPAATSWRDPSQQPLFSNYYLCHDGERPFVAWFSITTGKWETKSAETTIVGWADIYTPASFGITPNGGDITAPPPDWPYGEPRE